MKRKLIYLSIYSTLLAVQNMFGQSGGNNSLQIYTPEVYALARYGDIPVDISTGVPEINIPLMSISDRDISLDVSLSYQATGIKVDQEATWVGLGWVLNAGGIITRQIRGIRDGYSTVNGKFNLRPVIPDYDYPKTMSQYINEVQINLNAYARQWDGGSYDSEPDIFYYNFCGKAGKFILDNNAKACFFKYEDFKAELTDNSTFIITSDMGVKYEFKSTPLEKDCWNLTKIASPSGGEINFEYNNSYSELEEQRTYSTCFVEAIPQIKQHTIDSRYYHGSWLSGTHQETHLLSKIITKSGNYINFNRSTTGRLDVENSTNKALEEIVMYDNKNVIQKKVKLGYGYFEASNSRRYKRYDGQPVPNLNYLSYRLRLNSVKEISTTGETGKTYNFEYYGNNNPNTDDIYTLPYRLSPQQDHWGYYNHSNNVTIFSNNPANRAITSGIPDVMVVAFYGLPPSYGPELSSNIVTGGANRDPDSEAVKAGTLKKIIYPTGGYTQFYFEPNNSPGGGIRVKQIESNDGSGKTVIKNYAYEPFIGRPSENYIESAVSFDHKVIYNPFYQVETYSMPQILMSMGVPSGLAYKQNLKVIKIDGSSRLRLGIGMEAVYNKVTETITGGGRTEYYYSCMDNFVDNFGFNVNGTTITDAFHVAYLSNASPNIFITKNSLDSNTYPYPEPISNDWRNRLLVNKKVYREDNTLIAEDSISYRIETLYAIPSYKVNQITDYSYIFARSYTIGGLVKVSREVNLQQGVRTVKEYDYNSPFHKQVTESRMWNSAGELFTDKYYYPPEYGNTLSFLKDANMLLPVDVRSYKGTKLISGIQTKYNNKGLAEIKYRFDTGVNDIAFNSQNPYTFTPYVWNTYNTSGLWQTNLTNSGISTTYLWSYSNQYPIAKIENATYNEVKSALGYTSDIQIESLSAQPNPDINLIDSKLRAYFKDKTSLVTTYTYKPLVGILTMTDPRGVVTKYEYDSFNRLAVTRNMDNNIVSHYWYVYQGGTKAPVIENPEPPNLPLQAFIILDYSNSFQVKASVQITGGSGDYTISWQLKNASGTNINLIYDGTSVSFKAPATGVLTLQCTVTDNMKNISTTVSTKVLTPLAPGDPIL